MHNTKGQIESFKAYGKKTETER